MKRNNNKEEVPKEIEEFIKNNTTTFYIIERKKLTDLVEAIKHIITSGVSVDKKAIVIYRLTMEIYEDIRNRIEKVNEVRNDKEKKTVHYYRVYKTRVVAYKPLVAKVNIDGVVVITKDASNVVTVIKRKYGNTITVTTATIDPFFILLVREYRGDKVTFFSADRPIDVQVKSLSIDDDVLRYLLF